MNPGTNMVVRGGSRYSDREPYLRADMGCHDAASVRGYTQGFRTFRSARIPPSVTTRFGCEVTGIDPHG
jgi:hypothetical protein